MALSIIAIGKPGGCKSTSVSLIDYEFKRHKLNPLYDSDRLRLEDAVLQDIAAGATPYGTKPDNGPQPLRGEHGILFDGTKGPGQKVFHVTDGSMLNTIHDEMVHLALTHNYPEGMLFEIATGPDRTAAQLVELLPDVEVTHDIPLLQSGEEFVRRIRSSPMNPGQKVLIVEIDASKKERIRRNGKRIDGMKKETVDAIFPDGGELRQAGYALIELGINFIYYDNDYNNLDRFIRDMINLRETTVRTLVESGFNSGIEYPHAY